MPLHWQGCVVCRCKIGEPGSALEGCVVCRCKIGEPGSALGQFNSPHGFCLGLNEDIVVADTLNHRIQVFDKHGKFCSVFGSPGCCLCMHFIASGKLPVQSRLLHVHACVLKLPVQVHGLHVLVFSSYSCVLICVLCGPWELGE